MTQIQKIVNNLSKNSLKNYEYVQRRVILSLIFLLHSLFLIPSVVSQVTAQQATGQTTIIASTCGITFPAGSVVDYGPLIVDGVSPDVFLNMTNSGNSAAILDISGDDWKDSANNSIMNANQTTWHNVTQWWEPQSLNSTDTTVFQSFLPGINNTIFFELEAILTTPVFSGSATQVMDFTVTC